MYTINQLEMFRLVAETGSFNKAAEKAYVTPNAVMKHINNLEEELGTTLFTRTYRGQTLTGSGEVLYSNAVAILKFAEDTIKEVKSAAKSNERKIRVGTSMMTPIEPLINLWTEIRKRHPEIKFEIITFQNTPLTKNKCVVPAPGTSIDILIDSFDERTLRNLDAFGLEVLRVKMYAVLSTHHRLADKEMIDVSDLEGETIIYRKGMMEFIDDFISYLNGMGVAANHKLIDAYSMEVYNECADSEEIILGIGQHKNINPFLKRIPLDYDKTSPFGILYAKEAPDIVKNFVEAAREIVAEKKIAE